MSFNAKKLSIFSGLIGGLSAAMLISGNLSAQAQNFDESQLIIPKTINCDKPSAITDKKLSLLCADINTEGEVKKVVPDPKKIDLTPFQRKTLELQLELVKLKLAEQDRLGKQPATIIVLDRQYLVERIFIAQLKMIGNTYPATISGGEITWKDSQGIVRILRIGELFTIVQEERNKLPKTFLALPGGVVLEFKQLYN